MSKITLIANIASDIRSGTYTDTKGEQKSYCSFSVAESTSTKGSDGNWVDSGSIFWNIVLYGYQVDLFLKSGLAKGTPVIIVGDLVVKKQKSYTDKSGVTHPERPAHEIRVSEIGVLIGKGRIATSTLAKNGGSNTVSTPQQTPAQQTPSPQQTTDDFGDVFDDTEDFDDTELPF